MVNEEIKRKVLDTEICKNCLNVVEGKGNLNADILFIGESPGKNEDEQGLPFVGAAGKLLDSLLEEAGISQDLIYIANILKCRPPENRDPTNDEIKAHTPWLIEQIKEIKPKIICTLGNYATKFFMAGCDVDKMQEQQGITTLRGKIKEIVIDGHKLKLIPLFHPAALLYRRELMNKWKIDIKIVKKELEQKTLF